MLVEWNAHIFNPDTQRYPLHPKAAYRPDVSVHPPDPLAAYLQRQALYAAHARSLRAGAHGLEQWRTSDCRCASSRLRRGRAGPGKGRQLGPMVQQIRRNT